jgi:DNA topoisomerase-1
MGHIRDLPKCKMGVDVENNFEPSYQISTDKKKTVKTIIDLIKKSKEVFIATDEDREGEAIGWHIAEAAKLKNNFKRITFHEITPSAIKNAVQNPRELNLNLVNAQQARRILDRLVGYNLSPFLAKKVLNGLSAGRVQSSTLKIIVDREREIQNFKSEEYWTIDANCEKEKINFVANFTEKNGKSYNNKNLKTNDDVLKIINDLDKNNFIVQDITKKKRLKKPSAPFITSTLQQVASKVLNSPSKKTMQVAQSLYEGVTIENEHIGLITYMRTDSTSIASSALDDARAFIAENYGKDFLPKSANIYKTKDKNAQEAHECIRPTSVCKKPEYVKDFLTKDQFRLYELIWQRFVASQMEDAIFEQNIVKITEKDTVWVASGEVKLFNGFLDVYKHDDTAKDVVLPILKIGEKINVLEIVPKQHFTEPPSRYTEATLIKVLEKNGIGRPSTYAPTISTIQQRGYVRLEDKKFFPEEIGMKVTGILEQYFPNIVDAKFTAGMEEKLDKVAEGKEKWVQMLSDFYTPFSLTLKDAQINMPAQKELKKAERQCPECGEDLVYRKSRFGEFVGCSAYPKCKYIERTEKKQSSSSPVSETPEDAENIKNIENNLEPCPTCGGKLVLKKGRYGNFIGCSQYPKCKYLRNLDAPKIDQKCPDCGSDLVVKFSKRGKFLGCSSYPKCKHIGKL